MEQVGEYLVRRLIGEGGMGKVYEAEERLSKRRVALKVLHPELARSDEGRRLFMNEMQILAHLEHPNVVRSLASTEVDGQLVMVLEYLDGRTLRALLAAEGKLPWGEAVRIVMSIAGALAAAHGQKTPIIHRDLKPENIMVLSDGAVKVMDFGIAKVIEAMNQTNTQSVGTLQYMSPEQIDARTIDHRADLYCLGLIFYELITGKPPFHSASPRQLLNLQCTAEPPPLPDAIRENIPQGVEELLFQLLEKAPEDRPFLAEDVVDRLAPFKTAAPSRTQHGARASLPSQASSHRTPSSPSNEERRTPSRTRETAEAKSDAGSSARSARAAEPEAKPSPEPAGREGRADTIALLDKVDKPRDVPMPVAIGIIAVLAVLAGAGAYVLRATSSASDTDAASASSPTAATATATASAPGVSRDTRGR